jgi:hypothetical protein
MAYTERREGAKGVRYRGFIQGRRRPLQVRRHVRHSRTGTRNLPSGGEARGKAGGRLTRSASSGSRVGPQGTSPLGRVRAVRRHLDRLHSGVEPKAT